MPSPAQCRHCSRAIWWTADGWVHAGLRAKCCTPAGDWLPAEPRRNATADPAELEHERLTRKVTP